MSQDGFVLVLGSEDGVCEIAVYMAPFSEATIVEHFEFVCDDEGNDDLSASFIANFCCKDTNFCRYRQEKRELFPTRRCHQFIKETLAGIFE